MSEADVLFQKFQSASREDVRLELALEGYFSGLAGETQKQVWLTAGLLEDGLSLAISLKSTEGFVLLLRRKAELVGFSDRDFSL